MSDLRQLEASIAASYRPVYDDETAELLASIEAREIAQAFRLELAARDSQNDVYGWEEN